MICRLFVDDRNREQVSEDGGIFPLTSRFSDGVSRGMCETTWQLAVESTSNRMYKSMIPTTSPLRDKSQELYNIK